MALTSSPNSSSPVVDTPTPDTGTQTMVRHWVGPHTGIWHTPLRLWHLMLFAGVITAVCVPVIVWARLNGYHR